MPQVDSYVYRKVSVGGVDRATDYRELVPGSPEFSFADDQSRAVRQFAIPWEQQKQALLDFLGFAEVKRADDGTKFISRTVPHDLPGWPGYFTARRIARMEGIIPDPLPDDDGVGSFDEAKITVEYDSPMYRVLTDSEMITAMNDFGLIADYPDESSLLRFVEPDCQPAAKFQTFPQFGALRFTDNGVPLSTTFAVLLFEGDLTVKWWYVPIEAFPITAIKNTIGKSNSQSFGNAGWIFGILPAETLVCGLPATKIVRMANGRFGVHITYKFKWYPQGANSFFRTKPTPGFAVASVDGSADNAKKLFPTISFQGLFRPEP